ncbi:MAG: hydrolase, partial [Coprobacter sp.]|nr:hydrolase [Coprobacter sp.]
MNKGKLKNTSRIIWQTLFFIFAVSLTITFIPREKQFRYHFEEGKPWRYGLLTAPFDFPIYKSEQDIATERNNIINSHIPF